MRGEEVSGAAGPSRLPSRPETAPWNTIGLPKPTNAVRKAVREIESRLQEKIRLESRKQEEDVDVNQVARTRLLWQAREKGSEPVEYRTDYFPDVSPASENILILKVEEIPRVEKKDVTVQTTNTETIETLQIQSYFNYEKSWQDFRNYIWSSKTTGTINSNRVSTIESHIPRIKKDKLCGKCRRAVTVNKSYCDYHEKENLDFSVDPQRSRANFFGNSNSFALRCNLNAVQQPSNRRRCYLTSGPGTQGFESFQAKKRVFLRQKLNNRDGVLFNDVW